MIGPARARRFGIISMVILAEIIGVILMIGTPFFARLFNSDPNVVQIAVTQSRVENLFFFLLAFSHSIAGVCRGAGRATVPMLVMLGVWCTLRIVYITIAMKISHQLYLVFWSYPITWTVSSIIFLIYYLKSDWVHGFEHRSAHHRFHFH